MCRYPSFVKNIIKNVVQNVFVSSLFVSVLRQYFQRGALELYLLLLSRMYQLLYDCIQSCIFSSTCRYVICTGLRTNGKEVHDYLYYINEKILSLSGVMDILQVKYFFSCYRHVAKCNLVK